MIVEELVRCGADYFCVSPGSRSTPLTIAVARNKNAQTIVCYDERGAGFHALGYARATGKPAVVITTSGTAVANLFPAVMEASNDNIPLLVLTADRPPELIECGANQTTVQTQIFGQYARWHFELPCQTDEFKSEFVLTTIDQAVYRTGGTHAGPVHINCMFREPLLPLSDENSVPHKWERSTTPYTLYSGPVTLCDQLTISQLQTTIDATERGMLFVGKLSSVNERNAVRILARKLNWPVYADLSSGLRLEDIGTNVIRYLDQELLPQEFNDKVKPDVVLHLGGRITSKRVGLFFEQNTPEHFIVVKATPERADAVHIATQRIQVDVELLSIMLADALNQNDKNAFCELWEKMSLDIDCIINKKIDDNPITSEPFIARSLTENVPESSSFFVSNSMPVRDVDIYGTIGRNDILVGVNRGTSGIDGILATATGFAAGSGRMTTLLIGDVALLHDINSLSLIAKSELPVIVVVINNSGGGIFHFLPVAKETDVFEEFFATQHNFAFGGVCETFGIDYHNPKDKQEFLNVYKQACANGRSSVIEVTTDRDENLKLRKDIKNEIILKLKTF